MSRARAGSGPRTTSPPKSKALKGRWGSKHAIGRGYRHGKPDAEERAIERTTRQATKREIQSTLKDEGSFRVDLPHLGRRYVTRAKEPGHWLWLDSFGWHDCSPAEDAICNTAVA